MERDSAPHDNTTIKVNNSFNGRIVIVGGVYIGGITSLVLLLFMTTHWTQAVTLAAILVYGLVTAFGVVVIGTIAALWIRFIIHPGLDARQRSAEIRGQEMKNRILHWQENAIVAEVVPGTVSVVPLFPQRALPAPKEEEKQIDDSTIVEIYNHGATYETIMEQTGWKYNKIQRVISDAKKRGEIPA